MAVTPVNNLLGKTLIIVNPQAQSGAAANAAERLKRFLTMYLHEENFQVALTERPRHATELAANAGGFNTVLALGGDGVIHEVVAGLMRLPRSSRPTLGVVPVGSGNDFARTLGLTDCTGKDFAHLLGTERVAIDVIRVDHDHGTEYVDETFSMGLDAAIGLGTHDLRYTTGLSGMPLYMASAARAFGRDYRAFATRCSFDGGPAEDLCTITFAVQNGPTYGSGFQICPDADPCDGLMDICYACGPAPRLIALPVFLSAQNGKHVNHRNIVMRRAEHLHMELSEPDFPIQVDGERLYASTLDLSIMPAALNVFRPIVAK